MKRVLALLCLVVVGGCTEPLPDPLVTDFDPTTQPAAVQRVGLVSYAGATACQDLERGLEDRAVLEMRLRVAENKRYALQSWDWRHGQSQWPYGYGGGSAGGGSGGGTAGGSGGGAGNSSQDSGTSGNSSPTDYTTTNTQVQGVDEADFVKNDGTRLFVLSGRSLVTASTWPATALARRGQVSLPGHPVSMFLVGDQVVVFSNAFYASLGAPAWCTGGYDYDCESWYPNATIASYVDVSDLSAPRVVASQVIPGSFSHARRVGNAMRLVTSSGYPWLDGLTTWVDWQLQQAAPTKAVLAAMFDALANSNEQTIRARTVDDWFPAVTVRTAAGTSTVGVTCSDVVAPNTSAKLGVTHVVTLDLAAPTRVTRQTLLAAVDELYQSADSLYLAQRHWWWASSATNDDVTYVFKFDVSQPDRARFKAAGRVDGRPVNQFAFDEHEGYLRVATTVTHVALPSGAGGGWVGGNTVNEVVVLADVAGALLEVGRSEELAPGERIMSARFVGDVGYVVTFRQTDPLYTLDLSDPAHPTKVGELKVPGFSSYIHPLDATHLLTIGTYIPEVQTDWRERHLQLALFDVSDLAHPRQTFTQEVGAAWGWSEAQWDHKAFNYFPAKGTLAIPFADWFTRADGSWEFVSDLRVFHVDPQAGFTPKGTLDMADVLYRQGWCDYGYGCWSWYWMPQVRRSVMADDYVYAVSSGGVRVAHVDALDQPLATATFDPAP